MSNNDEKDLRIHIKQAGKKSSGSAFSDLFTQRSSTQGPDCMFNQESSVEQFIRKRPIIEQFIPEDERDESDETDESLTYSTTLKPMLRDMTGALEQRGELKINRYQRKNEVVWVVRIDNRRAKFLDRIFSEFIAFLKRAVNAE
jgi:hypothetical protein